MYETQVKSSLLYNCATLTLTKTEENRMDAFTETSCNKCWWTYWPTKIGDKSLCKKTWRDTPIDPNIRTKMVLVMIWDETQKSLQTRPWHFIIQTPAKPQEVRPTKTLPITHSTTTWKTSKGKNSHWNHKWSKANKIHVSEHKEMVCPHQRGMKKSWGHDV